MLLFYLFLFFVKQYAIGFYNIIIIYLIYSLIIYNLFKVYLRIFIVIFIIIIIAFVIGISGLDCFKSANLNSNTFCVKRNLDQDA